jgi:Family of unknown function (DUF5336)
MTYSPGSSGYPPAQPPGSYGAPTAGFGQLADSGPSKLPLYLTAAVTTFGVLAYLFSFGPTFTLTVSAGPLGDAQVSGTGGVALQLVMILALVAALLAGISLLPKATGHAGIVAVLAVVSVLLAVYQIFVKPPEISVGWGLWVVLALTLVEAIAAVGALLLESGVVSTPAPRAKYEQPQYGQYGPPGGYYGQPQQPQHPQHQGPPPGPRPGYPSQYGGTYPQGPSTGGFGAYGPQGGAQNGPPTPPTGYPSFSPPPAVGSGPQQPSAPGSGQQQPQAPAPSPGPSSS